MPSPTYVAIAKTVLTGSQATITFSSIPSTYTDLLIKISGRSDTGTLSRNMFVTFNGSTTSFSDTYLFGDGATVTSARNGGGNTKIYLGGVPATTATSNTFGNVEVYIPNYAGGTNKCVSIDSVTENNATTAYNSPTAGLWSNTAAITQIDLTLTSASFVSGSRFDLYGIKNS